MFADPQSITVNTVAQSLPAVSRAPDASVYRKDNGDYSLSIQKQRTRNRRRYAIRVDARKIAPDPLASSNNVEYTSTVILSMNAPFVGYTNAEIKDLALALSAWATSANLLRVLGDET
jgi:hypothetical protein